MTKNELQNKVLEANSKVDNCLTFLNPMTFDLFVEHMKEADKAVKDCLAILWTPDIELDSEIRSFAYGIVSSAEKRINQFLSLGYRVFGIYQLNAALGD